MRRGHRRLTVSYSPQENGPEGFYARLGFRPTGEHHVGQVVAERMLTTDRTAVSWLPAGFVHPLLVELPGGYHLRPIRASDTRLHHPAVMASRKRLWSIFGSARDWPPVTMTYDEDRVGLARHEAEIAANESFAYAVMDDGETALFGCVYIDPPEKLGADAEVSWWVVDDKAGTGLERDLDKLVPRWIADAWPFGKPRYIGRDLSWAEWVALANTEGGVIGIDRDKDPR